MRERDREKERERERETFATERTPFNARVSERTEKRQSETRRRRIGRRRPVYSMTTTTTRIFLNRSETFDRKVLTSLSSPWRDLSARLNAVDAPAPRVYNAAHLCIAQERRLGI